MKAEQELRPLTVAVGGVENLDEHLMALGMIFAAREIRAG